MQQRGVTGLPVVDDERSPGRRHEPDRPAAGARRRRPLGALARPAVRHLMTSPALTISADALIAEAASRHGATPRPPAGRREPPADPPASSPPWTWSVPWSTARSCVIPVEHRLRKRPASRASFAPTQLGVRAPLSSMSRPTWTTSTAPCARLSAGTADAAAPGRRGRGTQRSSRRERRRSVTSRPRAADPGARRRQVRGLHGLRELLPRQRDLGHRGARCRSSTRRFDLFAASRSPTRSARRSLTAQSHFVTTTKYAEVPKRTRHRAGAVRDLRRPVHCKGCGGMRRGLHRPRPRRAAHDRQGAGGGKRRVDPRPLPARHGFFRSLPPTPEAYRNEKALADLMLGEHAMVTSAAPAAARAAARRARCGCCRRHPAGPRARSSMGIVAATGCNTVFGSTYPFNPFLVPWTNSLFENAPTDAHGHSRRAGTRRGTRAPHLGHRRRRRHVRHRLPVPVADGRLRRRHQGHGARRAGLLEHRWPVVDRHLRRPGHQAVGLRQGGARAARAAQRARPDPAWRTARCTWRRRRRRISTTSTAR